MRALLYITLVTSIIGLTSFSENNENQEKINWLSFNEAVKLAEKKNKPIFIDVYTTWCGWCKVMDQKTFTNPKIISYINKHYYAVKLNAERKDTVNFKGKDYVFVKSGRRGYHELAATLLHRRLTYPTVVFFVENLSKVYPHPGYQRPEKLSLLLRYYSEEAYKRTDIDTFIKQNKQ